ncbi:MAG: porin family protein [Gammaproteobacteria bacterium]|nr:porin family protein [Gammaproteobacteria bacterium]
MKTRSILIAAVLAVLIPVTAFADSGFFLAASVGSAELSEDFDGFDVDVDSTAYRITAGWRFSDYLAVEGGYHNFGDFEQPFNIAGTPTDVSLKADGFTIGGIGSLPLGDRFALFARAGAFFWDGDADINNVTQAKPEDTNLYLGAGARLALSERLSLTADASRYDLDDTSSTVFSVGFELRF